MKNDLHYVLYCFGLEQHFLTETLKLFYSKTEELIFKRRRVKETSSNLHSHDLFSHD